jgi:hypothetical protein
MRSSILSGWAAACAAFVGNAFGQSDAVFPGRKGGQDTFGHYAVVAGWPKPLAQLAGHDGWTYGATQYVFAESPDRVFVLQRGELPALERPPTQRLREVAPSLEYPVLTRVGSIACWCSTATATSSSRGLSGTRCWHGRTLFT